MKDIQIIELYNERNENAIKQTDIKYGRYLKTISNNILKNYEDSKECVLYTYLGTWNSIPPVFPKNFKCYLARIVRNISIKRWEKGRSQKRGQGEPDLVLDELSDCIADRENCENSFEAREIAKLIDEFLEEIETEKRVLFVKRYFYMYSIRDLAKESGKSENAISAELFRIRKKLKQKLLGEGVSL